MADSKPMALLTHSGKIIQRELKAVATLRPELVHPLRAVEREAIESGLILCGGNRRLAAKRLGIAYRTLMRWIEEFRSEDLDNQHLA